MKTPNTALLTAATVALLALLGACAAAGTRVSEAKIVRSTDRGDFPKLSYVETQRMVTVLLTPEGPKDTVFDFDIDYQLENPAGGRTALPFLGTLSASPLDVLDRVFHVAARDSWIGLSVHSSDHSEHVQGMQWQYVADEFTTIRVVEFTRDRLVTKHDVKVCNPVRRANPVIHIDPASHTLRYCTRDGTASYDTLTGKERQLQREPCCPSSPAGGMTRSGADFVVEETL